ncbi:hypothetical protein Cpir12675_002102 [Ceratocystis pirilliformis]|uniref:Uncharacterized protein n=1 Tax=Ceratocystis pirilliformis TaxID=259994 RepID=A0ABR3ZD65_9PEZI
MIRTRRGAIIPIAIVTVLFFLISAHVFSSPESWSRWAPVPADLAPEYPSPATTTSPPVADNPKTHQPETPQAPEHTPSPLESASMVDLPASLNMTFEVPDGIVYNPNGPKPEQVIILTPADSGGHHSIIPKIHERTAANRKAWCDLHGYKYHFVDIGKIDMPDTPAVWKKIPAIIQSFNAYPDAQWVLVLDLDIIIMNPEQDLNSLVLSRQAMERQYLPSTEINGGGRQHTGFYSPPKLDWKNTDLIISQDHNGINAGSFFVRRSAFSQILMDIWTDPFFIRKNFVGAEQDTLGHLLYHHPTLRKHVSIVRQRVANSFYNGGDETHYQDGDLLVHLAGCWVTDKCLENFEDMWDRRKIAPASLSPSASTKDVATTNHEVVHAPLAPGPHA